MIRARCCLLITLMATHPALADIESEQVKAALAAYDALDFHRTIELLEGAQGETLTREERRAALRVLATCHVALGNDDAAVAAFRELVRLEPEIELDHSVSPRVRAALDRARASLADERVRAALLEVAPPSAPVASPAPAITAAPSPRRDPIYRRPWLWGTVGGAVALGVIVTVVASVAAGGGSGAPAMLTVSVR
jgi:hypothetical protein